MLWKLIILIIFPFSTSIGQNHLLDEGEHFITINEFKLWYRVKGNGPLLLIYAPGGGLCYQSVSNIHHLQILEGDRKVIYFEPRGMDNSQKCRAEHFYELDKYVEELRVFIDTITNKSIDLLCFCYGSMVGLLYSASHSENVDHLIIVNTCNNIELPSININNFFYFKDYLTSKAPLDQLDLWSYFERHSVDCFNFKKLDDMFNSMAFNYHYNDEEHNYYRIVFSLPDIKARTLIISTNCQQPIYKISSALLKKSIKHSELVTIPTSFTYPFIEQPKFFYDKTISFLNSQ